jgi:signal transduction histidine kinase
MLKDSADPDATHDATAEIAFIIGETIQEIRSLTFIMRPPILDTAGIDTALEWLCRSIGSDYGLQIEFSSDQTEKSLLSEVRSSLYLVVRELLLNVVKHAGVAKAQLSIGTTDGNLVIQILDNGVGFDQGAEQMDPALSQGFGLFNVRDRTERLGGSLVIESAAGCGTLAKITVPLQDPDQKE